MRAVVDKANRVIALAFDSDEEMERFATILNYSPTHDWIEESGVSNTVYTDLANADINTKRATELHDFIKKHPALR